MNEGRDQGGETNLWGRYSGEIVEAMEEVGVREESADRDCPLRSGAHVVEYGLWVPLVGHFAKGCWDRLGCDRPWLCQLRSGS